MLYASFWVIPRRLNFICRRIVHTYRPMKIEQTENSETSAYKIQTPRLVGMKNTYSPMKMEQTERCETSAYKFQTPGNYQKKAYNILLVIYVLCTT
jgi:hypothetical protein